MQRRENEKRGNTVILILLVLVILMASACLFVGSANMSLRDGIRALFGEGSAANVRIIRHIRIPRVLAALIAGAGLSVSGLIMQTTLNNAMASPSTLGFQCGGVWCQFIHHCFCRRISFHGK